MARSRFSRVVCRLPEILVAEIKRRLALRRLPGNEWRHSIRAICREHHVDRETVRAIDRDAYEQQAESDRCSTCGHAVLMPCRICAARRERAACRSVAASFPATPLLAVCAAA